MNSNPTPPPWARLVSDQALQVWSWSNGRLVQKDRIPGGYYCIARKL